MTAIPVKYREHYLLVVSAPSALEIPASLEHLGFTNITQPVGRRRVALGLDASAATIGGNLYFEADFSAPSRDDIGTASGVMVVAAVPVKPALNLAHYAEAGLVVAAGAFAAWWRWGRKRK